MVQWQRITALRQRRLQAASYIRLETNIHSTVLLYLVPRAINGRQRGVEVALFGQRLGEVLLKFGLLAPPSTHVHGELVVLLLEDGLRIGPPIITLRYTIRCTCGAKHRARTERVQ